MTTEAVRARARKRRRALTIIVSVIAIASSGGYWLAQSGIVSGQLLPQPAGVTNLGGKLATITTLSNEPISYPTASSQTFGYALARIAIPQGFSTSTQVYFTWTDPQDAGNPLNYCSINNNSASCAGWLEFAIYYPVQQGACTTNNTNTNGGPVVTVTDASVTYCLRQDTSASGKLVGTSSPLMGQVLVSKQMLGSYLAPGVSDPSSTPCPTGAPGSSTTRSWCTPSSATASTNVFYLVASVILPGYNVPGSTVQQSPASTLKFFFKVR